MKKPTGKGHFLVIVLALCYAFILVPASLTAESVSIALTAGGYRLVKTSGGGSVIEMTTPGYGRLNSPGDPALPEKIIELKVPESGLISNLRLTVDGAEVMDLPQPLDIAPAGPLLAKEQAYWGEGKSIVNGKNMNVYGRNAFFPGQTIALLPAIAKKEPVNPSALKKTYRLVRYIRLAFRPVAYNPVTHKVTLTQKAAVTVTYSVTADAASSIKSLSPAPLTTADYVIITTNDIVSRSFSLQCLKKMKEAAGHQVRIVTESDYGTLTGQAPDGRAEKIRQWLIDNYLTMGIDYVLLVGDPTPADPYNPAAPVGDIPMKMCYPNFLLWYYREFPTDYFYADLVGNWDLDGDMIYGEDDSITRSKSPDASVDPDAFSACWTGKLNVPADATYWFKIFASDGVRLYLDNDPTPVIDAWSDHPLPDDFSSSFILLTTGLHDIKLEYYQHSENAACVLRWQRFGTGGTDMIVIKPSDLYHFDSGTSTYIPGGLDGAFYNNLTCSGTPVFTLIGNISNRWGAGDNGAGQRQSTAQVSVGRIPVYNGNVAALDKILEKIIAYETDPGSLSWRESILLPAVPMNAPTEYELGELVKAAITDPLGYNAYRIYTKDYAPPTPELNPCTEDNVTNEWKNHYGMVTWLTHGGPESAVDIMDVDHARTLDTVNPSIVFEGSCSNGEPEVNTNLAYTLLTTGAVATVAGSRETFGSTEDISMADSSTEDRAYHFTYLVMDNGGSPLSVGEAMNVLIGNTIYVDMNTLSFNLYGDPDTRLFTTDPHARPVVDTGGPYVVMEAETIVLDASGSTHPDSRPLEYRWNTSGTDNWNMPWTTDPTCTLANCARSQVVAVQVRDDLGIISQADTALMVTNLPPTVDIGPDRTAYLDVKTRFTAVITDPANDIDKFEWDFGDGSSTISFWDNPYHAYTAPGTYTVTLRVWDGAGGMGFDTMQVTVTGVCPLSNENPARPWVKKQGNYTLSKDYGLQTEGSLSLKMGGTGYMVAATTVFSANEIRTYSKEMNLDIYMPSPATNPGWLGEVHLFITCPGANLYNYSIGQVNLTGLPLDSWQTLYFTLPDNVADVFAGSYNNIQLSVVVNTTQSAAKPYHIDYLCFSGETVNKPLPSRVENVWSATTGTPTYLTLNSNSENSNIYCQNLHADWSSQEWVMEPVTGYPDRVRIRNRWTSGGVSYYLTATGTSGTGNGDPVLGKALHTDWVSQIWIRESGRNGSVRFKSAWSNSTYLTVQAPNDFSAVVCQPNHPEWSSQEWNIR